MKAIRTRRSGARARRAARARPPRARPRLPGDGSRRPAGIPEVSRTSARRSSSRPRPGRDARWPCSTTTWALRSGSSKDPRRPWRSFARGSPTRRPAGSPRCSTRSTQSSVDLLVDTGEHDEALRLAAEMIPRLEASGDVFDLVAIRCDQARIFALRGETSQVTAWLEWLESTARETEDPQTHRLWSRRRRPRTRRARPGRGRRRAGYRDRVLPGSTRAASNYPRHAPYDGAHHPGDRGAHARRAARRRPRAPLPLRRARPRRGQRRAHRGSRGPVSQPPMPTPMPPIAGSGSGSSPSRRSLSSARAGASSDSHDRPRPHRSCNTPARSSNGSVRPPRSPRPTRSSPLRRDLRRRVFVRQRVLFAEDNALMLPKPLPGHRPRKT